jgi:hypothetical protein
MDMSGGRGRAGVYDVVIAFQAHSTFVISTNAVLGIDNEVIMCVQCSEFSKCKAGTPGQRTILLNSEH